MNEVAYSLRSILLGFIRIPVTFHHLVFFRYLSESVYDLSVVIKQTTPTTPILLLFSKERESAERLVHGFAQKKVRKFSFLCCDIKTCWKEQVYHYLFHVLLHKGEE